MAEAASEVQAGENGSHDTDWITNNLKNEVFTPAEDTAKIEEWLNKYTDEDILQAKDVDKLLKDFGHKDASFATCVLMNIVASPDLQIIEKQKAVQNLKRLGLDSMERVHDFVIHLSEQMLHKDKPKRNWGLFKALMDRAALQVSDANNQSITFSAATPNLILFSIIFAAAPNRHVFNLGYDFARFIRAQTKDNSSFTISTSDLSDITHYLWYGRQSAEKEVLNNKIIGDFEAYFRLQVEKEKKEQETGEKQEQKEGEQIDIDDI